MKYSTSEISGYDIEAGNGALGRDEVRDSPEYDAAALRNAGEIRPGVVSPASRW